MKDGPCHGGARRRQEAARSVAQPTSRIASIMSSMQLRQTFLPRNICTSWAFPQKTRLALPGSAQVPSCVDDRGSLSKTL
jgi:hypothetical protein